MCGYELIVVLLLYWSGGGIWGLCTWSCVELLFLIINQKENLQHKKNNVDRLFGYPYMSFV